MYNDHISSNFVPCVRVEDTKYMCVCISVELQERSSLFLTNQYYTVMEIVYMCMHT